MAVSDYDQDPANNTDISGINIAEGCSPGGINNAIRQVMADLASWAVLKLSGGTMTGDLTLSGAPTVDLHAATKKYVDDTVLDGSDYIAKAGDAMTGTLKTGLLEVHSDLGTGADIDIRETTSNPNDIGGHIVSAQDYSLQFKPENTAGANVVAYDLKFDAASGVWIIGENYKSGDREIMTRELVAGEFVDKTGDTMTGPLSVTSDSTYGAAVLANGDGTAGGWARFDLVNPLSGTGTFYVDANGTFAMRQLTASQPIIFQNSAGSTQGRIDDSHGLNFDESIVTRALGDARYVELVSDLYAEGVASGTYTPAISDGKYQTVTNDGAFTLAAPTGGGGQEFVLDVYNKTTPGVITFSGFTKVTGDTLTTTAGDYFFIYITVMGTRIHANVVAMQ